MHKIKCRRFHGNQLHWNTGSKYKENKFAIKLYMCFFNTRTNNKIWWRPKNYCIFEIVMNVNIFQVLCHLCNVLWKICNFFFFWIFEFYFIYFLHRRFLLVIYFTHISVHMSIPIFQFIPPPPPLATSPLGVHTFVLYICVSTSALQTSSSVPFF